MKLRQARKIMRQQGGFHCEARHKIWYWQCRWFRYHHAVRPSSLPGRRDHRIDKAITVTTRHFRVWSQAYCDRQLARLGKWSKTHKIAVHIESSLNELKSYESSPHA